MSWHKIVSPDTSFSAFLAAMSSSRSDVVTQCFRSCFRSCVPFFSFSVFGVLKSFNGVSRKFKGCLKFQGCFKAVLRVFTGNFNEV